MWIVRNDDLVKRYVRVVDVQMSERSSPGAGGYRRMCLLGANGSCIVLGSGITLQSYEASQNPVVLLVAPN